MKPTQPIDTPWSATWQPSDAAVGWAHNALALLADGGSLVIPGSMHIYTIDKVRKTLTLVCGDPNDPMAWHRKNVITFKRIGYTVLDHTPETIARN